MSSDPFRWTTVSFWVGGMLLIATSVVIYIWNVLNDVTAVAMLMGALMMSTTFFTYIGLNPAASDERARKIGTLSATWSWFITLLFTSMGLAFDIWTGRPFEAPHLLSTIVFIMTASMMITHVWYSRKGDIE